MGGPSGQGPAGSPMRVPSTTNGDVMWNAVQIPALLWPNRAALATWLLDRESSASVAPKV